MSIAKIKTGLGDVERELLACAINVSKTETPRFITVGYKIQDSSIEVESNSEDINDIHGDNYHETQSIKLTQTFEPHRISEGEQGELSELLWDYVMKKNKKGLDSFEVIVISAFLESTTGYKAYKHTKCSIEVTSNGGSSYVDMPITVHFG